MRCLRWLLVAAAAASPGCTVPDTLGLPCVTHQHCDRGQYCGPDDTCLRGDPPMTSATSTGPVATSVGSSSGSSGVDTTLVLEGTSSSSSSDDSTSTGDSSSGTTGPACGQALGSCDAIDLLFVMDNSSSMSDEYADLVTALPNVLNSFYAEVEQTCTYHLGVTATDTTVDFQPARCQQPGALMRMGSLFGGCDPWEGEPGHPPWVSEADLSPDLTCLFTVSTDGSDDETQMDTLLATVGGEVSCNEGFIREGVPLFIVTITDEDDDDDGPGAEGSMGGFVEWWNTLSALKPPEELGILLLSAHIEPGCDWGGGAESNNGSEWSQNLSSFMTLAITNAGLEFADQFQLVDICLNSTEVTNGLRDAAQAILPALCDNAAG